MACSPVLRAILTGPPGVQTASDSVHLTEPEFLEEPFARIPLIKGRDDDGS